MGKTKLVTPREEEVKSFPYLGKVKLNLNGKKPKKGKNLYNRMLNQIRRSRR